MAGAEAAEASDDHKQHQKQHQRKQCQQQQHPLLLETRQQCQRQRQRRRRAQGQWRNVLRLFPASERPRSSPLPSPLLPQQERVVPTPWPCSTCPNSYRASMGTTLKLANTNVCSHFSLLWSILTTCLLLLLPATDRQGLPADMQQLPETPGQWQRQLRWEGVAAVRGQYVTAGDATALREIQTSLGRTFNGWTGSLIDCLSAENVQCDNAGNVVMLVLCNQGLVGTVPSAIGRLTSLTFLCLKNNGFYGSIPPSFSNLNNLVTLRMSSNRLDGRIPDGFSTLVQLQYLNLAYNMLSSSIPSSLGYLPYLSYLDLKSNMVTSTIPDSFQNLQSLNFLILAKNRLSGTVPGSLSLLASLRVLYISENQLSGSLPSEIGNLQQLIFLAVAINRFQSTIPNSLSMLTELRALDLGYNQFEGSVPEWLGRLAHLSYLNLARNQLTGIVPATLMALTALTFLGGDASLLCPPNGISCPLKQAGYENLQFCKACVDFCRTCVAGMTFSPLPPPRWTPPQKPPPPPPRNPPPRNPPPPPRPSPPRLSPPPPRSPPRSPSPPPLRPPLPTRNPPPVRPPPQKVPPPVAKPLPPTKSPSPPPRRPSPPSIKSLPPPAKQASPPPFKSPPPVSKRPPPSKTSPRVPPGTGLSFGFAPALSFTPHFLNGQVFRHASVNYSYDSRRNWRIDSSTDWTTDNNALGQAIALPVKEQGPCAACWATAPVSAVSAAAAIVFNTLEFGFVPDLSVQQVISCGSSFGCDGGLPSVAFDYIANLSSEGQQAGGGLQGLFTENNYHYTTTNATCQLPTCRLCKPTPYGITMYEQADFYGWFGLLLTLQQQPAVVTLYAACMAFLTYNIGILDRAEATACDLVPNHAVVAVGYVLNAGVPYWILQNSWGTRWGEGGRVRIAITGGFGLCNMHLMPALYPVITTSNPCRDVINPCGSGTCVPNGDGSSRCECRDPFVSITNIDGRTQSCVPKAVCTFFLFNPCSVGTCVDDGLGGYSCICPLGFADGERSTDGAKTCVPSSAIGSQKYTVSVAGLTCSVIAASFSLTVEQLLLQNSNPPLVCNNGGVAVGTVVDVSHPATQAACNVLYTWNQGDNCVAVAQRFSLPGGYADLETLNPWLRCSMSPPTQPGMQVCVRRGNTPTSLPNCTNYYTAQKGDTCDSIRTKFQLDAFAFYALNPGIYCERLQLADLDLLASGQQVCVSADIASFRLCPTGSKPRSVVRGDTCLGLFARFFGSLQQMVAFNYGFRCAPQQLFVGKIICVPASASGGRPPPPLPKKARQMCDTSTSGGEMIHFSF